MENAALTGVSLANIALMLVVAWFGGRWLRDAVDVSRVVTRDLGLNDDETVEQEYLALLKEAETEIVMYDDGDGSLYQSDTVIQNIKDKINANPSFKVECVLNEANGGTAFETELSDLENVNIRQRTSNKSRVHYRLIDRRKGYVSCHGPGQTKRNRKLIDCSNIPLRGRKYPLVLERYYTDFYAHV